jgi:hypothetical protein
MRLARHSTGFEAAVSSWYGEEHALGRRRDEVAREVTRAQ